MSTYIDSKFENITVILDGNSYEKCDFIGCALTYSGEAFVNFNKCKFSNVSWQLVGAAGRTADFLRAIYYGLGSDGEKIINNFFQEKSADNYSRMNTENFHLGKK